MKIAAFALALLAGAGIAPAHAWDQGSAGRYGQVDADRIELGGVLKVPAKAPLDLTFAGTPNPNAVMIGAGNQVSYCPALSCIFGPPNGTTVPSFFDHQRASLLVSAETQDDAHSQESTVAITTTFATGYMRPYAASTAYAVGDVVYVGAAFGGATYRAVQAGTTGASSAPPATRPTTAPYTATDGTVRWLWINDTAINAKVGLYNEAVAKPGAGQVWTQANNLQLAPGYLGNFAVGTEFDFDNLSGRDCAPGVTNCLGLYIRMSGTNRSTAGIAVEGLGAGALFGARFTGPLASLETLSLGTTGGQTGIGIGVFTPASYSGAAIRDASTSTTGLAVSGVKTGAAIDLSGTAATGILLTGLATSQWQILGTGFSADTAGNVRAASLAATTPITPSSSSAPCSPGLQAWDASYTYVCVGPNTWKRAALSSWTP